MKEKLIDKVAWLVSMGLVSLISFYFASFAKSENVEKNTKRIETLEKKSAKKTDLLLIMSGLCIIDKKTCPLKEDLLKEK